MGGEHAEVLPETVLRHFPAKAEAVRGLAWRDQNFRDMCQELGEALAALARMENLPPGIRAERQEECLGWIDRLKHEMEEALTTAKVIPLPHQKPAQRS